MKVVTHKVDSKTMYLIPMGDLHIGDKGFNEKSENNVKGYVDWVKKRDNARVFLMGDIVNNATISSKSSVFQQKLTLNEQIDKARSLFEPIKEKIIGAIEGNHEDRLDSFAGMTATQVLCNYLGIEYCKYSALLNIKVGKKARGSSVSNKTQYTGYMHHTTGGGSTLGSKVNRVAKLSESVTDAGFYCGGHNHALFVVKDYIEFKLNPFSTVISENEAYIIGCGSYLHWNDNYSEKQGLRAVGLGSPRIRLDGLKKDVHASV